MKALFIAGLVVLLPIAGISADSAPSAIPLKEISCFGRQLRMEVPVAWGEIREQRGVGRVDEEFTEEGTCWQTPDGKWSARSVHHDYRRRDERRPLEEIIDALRARTENESVEVLENGYSLERQRPRTLNKGGTLMKWRLCAWRSNLADRCAEFETEFAPGTDPAAMRAETDQLERIIRAARLRAP